MVQPAASANALEALAALGPWGAADGDATNWALLRYLDAILGDGQLQDIDDWVRDNPITGAPGWSSWMDPTTAPAIALGWLGQFVGLVIGSNLTSDQERTAIENIQTQQGFQRGTVGAFITAAQAQLTGTKSVTVQERFGGDAYTVRVITLESETPNPEAVRLALVAQKPAGLILEYVYEAGTTWAGISSTWAAHPETWASLSAPTGG